MLVQLLVFPRPSSRNREQQADQEGAREKERVKESESERNKEREKRSKIWRGREKEGEMEGERLRHTYIK